MAAQEYDGPDLYIYEAARARRERGSHVALVQQKWAWMKRDVEEEEEEEEEEETKEEVKGRRRKPERERRERKWRVRV